MNNIERNLMRYGVIKTDIETKENNGYRRIRVIEYQSKRYFHHMFNGEVVECYELIKIA